MFVRRFVLTWEVPSEMGRWELLKFLAATPVRCHCRTTSRRSLHRLTTPNSCHGPRPWPVSIGAHAQTSCASALIGAHLRSAHTRPVLGQPSGPPRATNRPDLG